MSVFTKINGKLARWEVDTDDYMLAIRTVRDELGVKQRHTILALVKS